MMEERKTYRNVDWLEQWLNSLSSLDSSVASRWNEDSSHYARYRNSFSQSEVAVELYHALHQSDLSLKDISQHISQIGNILHQVDLRQLGSQPKSRQRQMFAPIFDCADISQALPECHVQDSYAYVYMLVRLLYEILLYTRSMAVRFFCFQQIMRNAHVIRVLFGLITRSVTLKGSDINIEGNIPASLDCMSTIGQLPRKFSFNAMDNIMHKMLVAKDINLRISGIELVSLCPIIVACNPKLLGILLDTLMEPMAECAYRASLALATVMPYVPAAVANVFLQTAHDHCTDVPFNAQRIQSLCAIALGCLKLPIYTLAYRMCWNIWLHIDAAGTTQPSASLIIRESQFYLMLTSTIICMEHPELCMRQRRRLEWLLYDHKGVDCNVEIAFCMNVLYRRHGELKDILRILKVDIPFPALVRELQKSVFRKQLKEFKSTLNASIFSAAIGTFETLLTIGLCNMKFISELKDAFKHLKSNCTYSLIRILKLVGKVYPALSNEHEYLRSIVFRSLETMVRICCICEAQRFTQLIPDALNSVKGTTLMYLLKPLLSAEDFVPLDDRLDVFQVNAWVSTFHYLGNIQPLKVHRVTAIPLSVNLLNGNVKADQETVNLTIGKKKDVYNRDIVNGHIRKLINKAWDRLSNGEALLHLINLSLRLGFYEEAAFCLKQVEIWVDRTLLWFNGLYYYAMAECEKDPIKAVEYRVQGLDALDSYQHQCAVWSVQKTANDVMAPSMNYTMPSLVTQTWCTLKLILQVAICNVLEMTNDGKSDLGNLSNVFMALFANYRVLRWCFTGTCSETTSICEIYEGICIFLHILCEKESPKTHYDLSRKDCDNSTEAGKACLDPQEALRGYIMSIFEVDDAQVPQTLFVIDLLSPALKARLYSISSFLPICTNTLNKEKTEEALKGQTELQGTITQVKDLSPYVVFKEFLLYTRVRVSNKNGKANEATEKKQTEPSSCLEKSLVYISRDIDDLIALEAAVKSLDGLQQSAKHLSDILQRLSSLQLPTPVGVLKNFPLPFPAFTALLEYEKRLTEGPVAIHLQGSIRNAGRHIPWVKVKVLVAGTESDNVEVFHRRIKLRKNVIEEYVHLQLSMRQIETCRVMCVAMDNDGRPRGVATHFLPFVREFNPRTTVE